jgi:glycerophosphoryl diester phosphodiesterase
MFSPGDAQTLHDAGVGVRVTMPRPERMLLRQRYGLDDQAAIAEALSSGLIDALAGDDTDVVASLVRDSVST